MTVAGDGARAFAARRARLAGDADTVSVVHDGGTLTSVAAWFRDVEGRTEDAGTPHAPHTLAERRWTFLVTALASATLHEGRTLVVDSGARAWRVERIRYKRALGLVTVDAWRAVDYAE